MKISIFDQQKILKLPKKDFKKLVTILLEKEKIETDYLGIYFVNNKRCGQVHKEFFNDPSPTDCMSFPIDDINNPAHGHHYLGDVFVCTEVAQEICEEYGHTLEEETALYLIHSILHLIGYDDKRLDKRKIMRKKESEYLKIYKNLTR